MKTKKRILSHVILFVYHFVGMMSFVEAWIVYRKRVQHSKAQIPRLVLIRVRMLKTTAIWNWHGTNVKIWVGSAFFISAAATGEFNHLTFEASFLILGRIER